MKYIKMFEGIINTRNGFKIRDTTSPPESELTPGYMYIEKDSASDVCYIGNNKNNPYPVLCLIFEKNSDDKYYFIEWIGWMARLENYEPLNMTLKDYIIKNKIVKETLNAFKYPQFSGGGGGKKSLEKIKILRDKLLQDDDLSLSIEADKYNL